MSSQNAPIKIGKFSGQDVLQCKIKSATGVTVDVMNFGAAIRDWQVPMPDGTRRSVVLGFDQFEHYPERSPFFGAIVGRVANRIGGAKSVANHFIINSHRFFIDGHEFILPANEGKHHLHGGTATFGKRLWQMHPLSQDSVQLVLNSPDGDGGYPGNLSAKVLYKLDGCRLTIEFEAESDKPTPVNLVQHNYFNLAGHGDIRDHQLTLAYTPTTPDLIPTGQIQPVDGTELDFRAGKTLRDQGGQPINLDHNFVLNQSHNQKEDPVAVLKAPDAALQLRLWTDQPGLQIYSSGGLAVEDVPGLHGQKYPRFGGICLEDQNFPDAINRPEFPSPIIRPGKRYRHWCQIEIA